MVVDKLMEVLSRNERNELTLHEKSNNIGTKMDKNNIVNARDLEKSVPALSSDPKGNSTVVHVSSIFISRNERNDLSLQEKLNDIGIKKRIIMLSKRVI